jgi:hypothetical protein
LIGKYPHTKVEVKEMVSFDPTFRLGDLVQITAFLGVGISAYYGIKAKLAELAAKQELNKTTTEMRLDIIDATLEDAKMDLKNSQAQDLHIAQQRSEIDRIWKLLEDLRHWKGFVNPDGEYDRRGIINKPDKN